MLKPSGRIHIYGVQCVYKRFAESLSIGIWFFAATKVDFL